MKNIKCESCKEIIENLKPDGYDPKTLECKVCGNAYMASLADDWIVVVEQIPKEKEDEIIKEIKISSSHENKRITPEREVHFSFTFLDGSRINGTAIKLIHNGKDITNNTKQQIMECLINNEDKIEIITKHYKLEFYVGEVAGFTI